MSSGSAGTAETALPLRRPPIKQSTTVRSDIGHTFDVFVRTIGQWWPRVPFSRGCDRVRDVTLERRLGGRVYESWDDGTTIDWGRLLVWEPPHRFVMSWEMTPATTQVELRFGYLGPSLTRVSVEHRGWERLSQEQLSEDCALPGGYLGDAFDKGWAHILGRFVDLADSYDT